MAAHIAILYSFFPSCCFYFPRSVFLYCFSFFTFVVFPCFSINPFFSLSTVDSYIGKFRVIFAVVGRQDEWESSSQLWNATSALGIKSDPKAFTAEQLQARVTAKQAVPLFLPKPHSLSRVLNRKMNSPGISALQLYILASDQAFSKQFSSVVIVARTWEMLRPPRSCASPHDGFLFNHIWGKLFAMGPPISLVYADTRTLPSTQSLL